MGGLHKSLHIADGMYNLKRTHVRNVYKSNFAHVQWVILNKQNCVNHKLGALKMIEFPQRFYDSMKMLYIVIME